MTQNKLRVPSPLHALRQGPDEEDPVLQSLPQGRCKQDPKNKLMRESTKFTPGTKEFISLPYRAQGQDYSQELR